MATIQMSNMLKEGNHDLSNATADSGEREPLRGNKEQLGDIV